MINLSNNSNIMNTIVETFLEKETVELIYDNEQLEKWNKLVEEYQLTGQKQIAKKDKSPIPFMHIKQTFLNVIETLCPINVDVKDFSISPIPLEILDLIALSIKEEYFDYIQIRYDDVKPDPFCVGVKYQKWYVKTPNKPDYETDSVLDARTYAEENNGTVHPYSWNARYYLIGKWGDVKRSFDELSLMATERYIKEKSNDLRQIIKESEIALQTIIETANKRFDTPF